MRTRLLTLVAVALLVTAYVFAAPAGMVKAAGTGHLRFVHASPDAPAIDLYVDNKVLTTNLGFGAYTGFVSGDAKQITVDVRPAGAAADSKPILSKPIDLTDGMWAYVMITGLLKTGNPPLDLSVFPTDHSATNGKSRWEVINVSPGSAPFDVKLDGKPGPTNIAYGKSSGPQIADQGIHDVSITQTGKTDPVAGLPGATGANGFYTVSDVIYTEIVLGTPDKIQSVTLTYGTYLARLVNAASDSPALDFYVDGKKAVTGLKYGQWTNYILVDNNIRDFALRPTGAPADSKPLFDRVGWYWVPAGRTVTFVITGLVLGKDKQALDINNYWNPPIMYQNNSYISFINASPDSPAVDVLVNGKPAMQGFQFTSTQGRYAQPGAFSFDVVPAGKTDGALTSLPNVPLAANMQYTMIMVNPAANMKIIGIPGHSYVDVITLNAQAAANATPPATQPAK